MSSHDAGHDAEHDPGRRGTPGPGEPDHEPEETLAAEALADRLDRPMGVLGVLFLFVVLGQLLVTDPVWVRVLNVAGWVFWGVFVAEFLLRAYIAQFRASFWRRNWWQVIFLLIPFLRFFRALRALRAIRVARLGRAGGILSAGVRGSRSAGRLLTGRIGWLGAVTAVVVLASSQLLYALESHRDYSTALYEAALATVTGSGITTQDPFSRILQVVLAVYSVVVFATLAGSLGAYFLRDRGRAEPEGFRRDPMPGSMVPRATVPSPGEPMALNASTYITFPGNARDAMTFYHEVFGGDLNIMSYADAQMEDLPFEPEPTAVAHADLTAPGLHLTGGDDIGTTPGPVRSDTYSIMLITDTVEEGKALIAKLAADGEVVMPYEPAPWGDTYGQVRDRFDVLWQVDTGPQSS